MTAFHLMKAVTSMLVLTLNGFAGEPLDPAKPDGGNAEWRMRHGERVADVKSHANDLDVLFIGDSITSGWRDIGKAIWEKEFVPLHAVNIGIAGSQTSHVLWQFENGAIDGINPRVAVLMIGVNNVMASPFQSTADVAGGVSTIVARLREKLPHTKILLLGTFPKDREPDTPDRRKIGGINALIAKLDDGKWLRYLDIGGRLLDKDNKLTEDVSADGVHLTEKGYQKWADAITPVLREMRVDHSNVAGCGQTSPDAPGMWEMGPFVKRDKPVLSPTPDSKFQCPILGKEVRWEEQNVYNPAAVVRDGKVYLLYRADDKNPDLKWGRTCRIGLASSEDGINFTRHPAPVLYPDNDPWKQYEWEGGCEDLHVVEGEDGIYYMNYTTWNGGSDTMSVASSRDLYHWTKHGPAFRKATPDHVGGRSGVVISRLAGDRLVAAKINGKYWMYYTHPSALAWSDNLIDWTRADKSVWGGGHEAGAMALLRDEDILLMFNTQLYGNGWTLGQALIDRNDLKTVLKDPGGPFFYPELEWEKKGFTEPATVANTLVPFKGRWLLYYGAADRCIGLATCRAESAPEKPKGAPAAPGSATIHWRPAAPGVFGDANPFFWKGEYHVFYLLPDKGSYVWEHIVSKDLVHWRELPRALEAGRQGEPDEWNAASGSVVERDGTFHIFYVGFNSGHRNGRQQIMHATSPDLIKWTKHPEDTFAGDGVTYWSKVRNPPPQGDPDESFRDPYVWWNDKDQRWWMAVVAKDAKTHQYVLGRCISTDLVHWEQVTPFQNIRGDDCPDIFQSGDRWYCIRNISYYSSSESLLGPYQPDGVLRFDTEHLCVAKRMWDGRRHVGMGWIRDLAGNRDTGEFGWGGNQSIPREFFSGSEGLLCTRPVPEVTALFTQTLLETVPDKPQSVFDVPADYMLQASFQLDPSATLVVGFRQQPKTPGSGYRLTIHPRTQQIEIAGPRYVYPRRCPLDASKPIQVQAFVEGSILECFVNDAYAFTLRGYDFTEGKLTLEASNGSMRVLDFKVKTRSPE